MLAGLAPFWASAGAAGCGVQCCPSQSSGPPWPVSTSSTMLRQGQKMLNDGRPMVEVIKELQVTEATCFQRIAGCGGWRIVLVYACGHGALL